MSKKALGMVALAAASAALGWGSATLAGERTLPAAVTKAIETAFPGAKLGKSHRAKVTRTFYEVLVEQSGGAKLEVKVADDGTVVMVEGVVDRAALPPAVASRLTKEAGEGTIKGIERAERRAALQLVKLAEPKVTYEAEITRGSKTFEIGIAADGALLADDDDDDDDGEDDDDDDDDGDDDGEDDDDDDDDDRGGKMR